MAIQLNIGVGGKVLKTATIDGEEVQHVAQPQSIDTGNTKTVLAADASPGSPWVGTWTRTRSLGVVRQLVVLASTRTVGGTFTFEFGENGTTAVISEARVITDFTTVRDFDLINAGEFFRVKYEPATALSSHSVFVTTTNRRQNDGAFVRLANQEIEEANSAMGQTFAYQKAFDPSTGKSVNIRPGATVTGNSSSTPLTGGAAFNASGSYFSLDNISSVAVSVTTDVSGTLFVDNAMDSAGASLLRTSSFAVTGGTPFFIGLSALARFMRIRYVNGVTAQASFLLQTNTKTTPLSATFQRSDTALADASILQNTKAIISGRAPSGAYLNVPVNKVGNLIGADFLTEVAKGNVSGHALVNRVGYNPDIDTVTYETVWQAGGVYPFPGAAGVVSTASSSLLDTAAGTGARTVLIEGLNSAHVEVSETITLNGILAVVTTTQFLRLLRVSVVTAGVGAANAGVLTSTIGGVTVSAVSASNNRSALGVYTVPAGKTGYLLDLSISQSNNSASSIAGVLWATDGQSLIFRRRDSFGGHSQSGGTSRVYRAPMSFAEKTDIRIDAVCGATNNEVHLLFNLLIVDN